MLGLEGEEVVEGIVQEQQVEILGDYKLEDMLEVDKVDFEVVQVDMAQGCILD